jgi:tetratricopeptide (TPR) repeat protein
MKLSVLRATLIACMTLFHGQALAGMAELRLTDTKDKGALQLQSQAVQIQLEKTSASYEYVLTYLSRYDKESQGTFYFTLPADGFVQEFGYWVGSKYQKASVVRAKEGRAAFETQVRRGIDPALVESTAGNNFKMRVYPIFPGKPFKVRILVTVPATGVNGTYTAQVPLAIEKVPAFSLKVSGQVDAADAPEVLGLPGLKLAGDKAKSGRSLTVSGSMQASNILPPDEFTLRWKRPVQKSKPLSMRRYDEGRSRYFEARFTPELQPMKLAPTERAVVFWDHSLSEEPHHADRLATLAVYLQNRQPKTVDLYSFANTARKLATVSDPTIEKISQELAKVNYDGGTRIDIATDMLRLTLKSPENKNADVLLMTNGLDSFELYDFKRLSKITGSGNQMFIVSPRIDANVALLQKIATGSQATMIDQSRPADQMFTFKPWKLTGLSASKGLIEFEIPGSKTYFPGEEVVVRGQMRKDGPVKFRVKFAHDTRSKDRKKIEVAGNTNGLDRDSTPQLARIWAKSRIDRMLPRKRANQASITDLGVRHQLLTPYTVMLVLETCEDYREFDLEPPADCIKRKRDVDLAGLLEAAEDSDFNEEEEFEFSENNMDDDYRISDGKVDFDAVDIGGRRKTPETFDDFEDEAATETLAYNDTESPFEEDSEIIVDSDTDEGGDDEELDYIDVDSRGTTRTTIARNYGFEPTLRTAAAAGYQKLYSTYISQRKLWRNIPYYYLLTAELMAAAKQPQIADTIASNVTEIRPGEARWLTVYAYNLLEWDRAKDAIPVFKAVTELREEDPAGYRDLGLALEQFRQPLAAMNMYERVLKGSWDRRLAGIQKIILHDLVRVGRQVLALPKIPDDVRKRASDYVAKAKQFNDKIVVTATWDSDNTNIDLIIEEPGGRRVTPWGAPVSQLGGRMFVTADQGFGPEQYRNAAPYKGQYRIIVAYEMADHSAIRDGTFVRVDILSVQNGVESRISKTILLKDELEIQQALLLDYQDRLASLPPPSFSQSVALAKDQMRQGKAQDAVTTLERLGKQNNLNLEAERLFHLARAFGGLRQYQKAEEYNQAALVYKPSLYAAHYNNACYASLAGNKKKAFHHLGLLSTALNTRGTRQRRHFMNLMMTDSDLNPIRTAPEFRKALNSINVAH